MRVQVSRAYKKMEITSVRKSLIFDGVEQRVELWVERSCRAILLDFSFASAGIVSTILTRISGLILHLIH